MHPILAAMMQESSLMSCMRKLAEGTQGFGIMADRYIIAAGYLSVTASIRNLYWDATPNAVEPGTTLLQPTCKTTASKFWRVNRMVVGARMSGPRESDGHVTVSCDLVHSTRQPANPQVAHKFPPIRSQIAVKCREVGYFLPIFFPKECLSYFRKTSPALKELHV